MKFLTLSVVTALTACLSAQTPPAPAPAPLTDDTVVATSGDRKITAGYVNKLLESLPPPMRQNYQRDPKGFLSQYMLLEKLVAMALAEKLQEQSPYKENIEMARKQVLWQAIIERTSLAMNIPEEDLKKAYDARKDNYTQAKVKLIYIPFVATAAAGAAGKKDRTEAEALAKAEQVTRQARAADADFVKLVNENSEDPISKGKGGDFGPIKRGDNLPDAIKQAVFKLKANEVSDPIRQPNGYYVFKMMELVPQSYDEVKPTLQGEQRNEKLKAWMESNAKSVELKVERADFFQPPAPQH